MIKISCNLYAGWSGTSEKPGGDGSQIYEHGHFCAERFEKEIDDRSISGGEFHFIINRLNEIMKDELDKLLAQNRVKGNLSEMIENNPLSYGPHLCNGEEQF